MPWTYTEEGHIYRADGRVVPSATQSLTGAGLVSYEKVNADILERKSAIGRAVHECARLRALGILDRSTIHPDVAGYFESLEKWLAASGFVIEAVEESGVVSINGMVFGFRRDMRGHFPGKRHPRRAIGELKTTAAIEAHQAIQLVPYVLASDDCQTASASNFIETDRFIVQCQPDGKIAKMPPTGFFQDSDLDVWLSALCCETWRRNHNA